jgi:alpha-mannosidase
MSRIATLILSSLVVLSCATARIFGEETVPATKTSDRLLVRPIRGLIEKDGKSWQPVEVVLQDPQDPQDNARTATAVLTVDGKIVARQAIAEGSQSAEVLVPAVEMDKRVDVSIKMSDVTLVGSGTLRPVRKLTIYILPHSHHDLGYTDLQPKVEKIHIANLQKGLELARKTADYPEGSRFVWNEEVLWGTDQYVRQLPEADRAKLVDAVNKGWVSLNAMYGNTLTACCRPEELIQLFGEAKRLSDLTGVKIDCAMQSDVPGDTWGLVTALAQAGVRYYSLAPNFRSRVGNFLPTWRDKPFWWVSPSGKEKVLVWMPRGGYAYLIVMPAMNNQWVGMYQKGLDDVDYPYDISYVRYAMDNEGPQPKLPEFVRDWNAKYTWPKMIISSTKTAFSAMEKKYGDKLPEFKGDLTPYWEDGAGSSARETAMNRNSADRIVQAETLFAMLGADRFPLDADQEAWRNVLLYSEHTWGAADSVEDADSAMTTGQWKYKKAYADDAETQSKALLDQSLAVRAGDNAASSIDVFNTTSWPRTEVVLAAKSLSSAGDRVTDRSGKPVPSQRLSTGELAILAREVPPFAAVRFNIAAGVSFADSDSATTDGTAISNGVISARIDQQTGGISELKRHGSEQNFAAAEGEALNDYVYMIGDKPSAAKGAGTPTITVIENGPLVAMVRIESDAPGCNKLTRDIRLVAGDDHLDLTNVVDKKRVTPNARPGKNNGVSYSGRNSKESVNFAFPFNVDGGQIRLNAPMSVVRPELDQLPGSCKDWMEVGRWADVSNDHEGVTLATLDAPLVEIGKLSTLLGIAASPDPWRKHIEPTQKIFSWVMNNHWYTNYCAYQEGVVTFRYALRPHGSYDAAAADRFGTELTQPLIVSEARGPAPTGASLLRVEPADVLVTAFKPSIDGKAWIVRLFGASGQDRQAKLTWSAPSHGVSISDVSEKPLAQADDTIAVPGWDLVTLRVER